MLVLQGAAPGAAAGRRVVVTGLVVELAGQRLRGPAVRGERFLLLGEPSGGFRGAGCASRARGRTRGDEYLFNMDCYQIDAARPQTK